MRRVLLFFLLAVSIEACAQAVAPAPEGSAPQAGVAYAQSTGANSPTAPPTGRYQLVVVPGHSGSPFLLDSTTGCLWHQVQNQETKRSTFVEVDVENLHWSWGSGAQQILASRVESSELPDEQKRTLKETLQKTACGLSKVVLTPGPQAPPSK